MKIAVIGSGAFGTALAVSLARKGPVVLWSRSKDQVGDMLRDRVNHTRLPDAVLPTEVRPTSDFGELSDSDIILLSVPMQKLRTVLQSHPDLPEHSTLVACCKGIELDTGLGPVSVIRQEKPQHQPALLTGPSFAADIASGLPTALTLACETPELGQSLQHALTTETLRLYRTTDLTGAEIGGALKNVMAIACGAVIGAGLGNSARAALMTRGYAEMARFAVASGAQPETLNGLSGFGDLALTCTSEQSRNFRLGQSIGSGETFDPSVTVEGAATAIAVSAKAEKMAVEMPITKAVAALVQQKNTLSRVMSELMARSLKEE